MTAKDVRHGVARQSGLTGMAATVAIGSGLLLDLTVAGLFGAGRATDAFVAAARIPLALLAMVMAAANQALVPTFSTWLARQTSRRTSRLVSSVLYAAIVSAGLLAAVLALVSGPLTALIAPGFTSSQQQLASELARTFVLVIPLTAGSEVLRAYLNARYSFVMPAAMTVVLNLVSIGVILTNPHDISIVPWGYVIGGLAQFLVMAVAAWRRGLRFAPERNLRDPELTATASLMGRPLLSAALNPLARVAELLIASMLPSGSATIIHYGNRLVSAIGGTVLFRSVVVALVPRLARAEGEGRTEDVQRLLVLGLRIMIAISVPLTALFATLAVPGTRLVFEHGRFDDASASLLGLTLVVYAASFVGSAVQRALLTAFYARLDTITPLRNTIYGVGANILLLPLFVYPFRGRGAAVVAVAAAYSVSQYVNVGHALFRLQRERPVPLRRLTASTVRSTVAAAIATIAIVAAGVASGIYRAHPSELRLTLGLAVSGLIGLVIIVAGEIGSGGGPLRQLRSLRNANSSAPRRFRRSAAPRPTAASATERAPTTDPRSVARDLKQQHRPTKGRLSP